MSKRNINSYKKLPRKFRLANLWFYLCSVIALIFILCNGIYADEVNNKISEEATTDSALNLQDDSIISGSSLDEEIRTESDSALLLKNKLLGDSSTTVNIIYDFNGGKNSADETSKTETYDIGSKIEIYDPTIDQDTHELDVKKDGRYFVGWQTTSDYSDGEFYTPGQEIELNQNMTLYARWSNYLFIGGEQKNSEGQYSTCQTYLCPNGLIIPFGYELWSNGAGTGKYYCQYYRGYPKDPNADATPESSATGLRLNIDENYKSFLVGNSYAAFNGSDFGNANRYYRDFRNNCIVCEWDLANDDLLLKMKIYYDGLRYFNMKWEISNKTQEKIFKDLKLVHGSDTYFYGADHGTSFCSTDLHMVYLKNEGYYGLMCFYGDEYSEPSHYYAASYSGHGLGNFVNGGNLIDKIDSNYCDNGFYLQWDKETLGPDETWEIGAVEGYTEPKVVLGILGAPMTILKGQTARYTARIQNFFGLPKTIGLETLSEHGFETKIFDMDSNEINSLEVPGLNGFKEIILEQYIPIDTEFKSDQLTLKLTDSDNPENDSETSVMTNIADEIRVIYYGNGNTSGKAPETQKYIIGEEIIVSGNINNLFKDGFNFYGWSENSHAKITDEGVYRPGDILPATKDVMLEAVWFKVIESQTEELKTEYGNDLIFEINPCEGLNNLEYEWYKNNARILGNKKNLVIAKPEVKETGNKYYCKVTGERGEGVFSGQSKSIELEVNPKPLNIELSHTGIEELNSKINLKAEITNDLNGLLKPGGQTKFLVNNNEVGVQEIKKAGGKYYAELEWQTDRGGHFDFRCEYVGIENDNYKNGVCSEYRITVPQLLDIILSHEGEKKINNKIKVIAEVKNTVEDFGDPNGQIKFLVNNDEVGVQEIKKAGGKYYAELEWQTDRGGHFDFRCEYVGIENDNYKNGVCNEYKITVPQPLDIILSHEGNEELGSDIKIIAEIKNVVEDFGYPKGKIKFFVNDSEIEVKEIKKAGDKYYSEIEWQTQKGGHFDFRCEYLGIENDNYKNGICDVHRISFVQPLDIILSYEGNEELGSDIKIIAEVKNIREDFGDPKGRIKFFVNNSETEVKEIKKTGDKWYAEMEWQTDKGGYFDFKSEYVITGNDRYENGNCDRYKITVPQPLDIILSYEGNEELGSDIKIIAEIKNVVEDFGYPTGKIKFIINGKEIGIKDIKKIGDKYYAEIEWKINGTGDFDLSAEYVETENDNYKNNNLNSDNDKEKKDKQKMGIEFYDWNVYSDVNNNSNVEPDFENFAFENKKIETYNLRDIKIPEEIKRKGFIKGYPGNSFKPDSFITRAETAQIVYNLIYDVSAKKDLVYNNSKYIDLESHWSYKTILFLLDKNIMVFDDDNFQPDEYIKRVEFAQVLFDVFMYFDDNINKLLVDGDVFFEANDIKNNNMNFAVRQLASNGIMIGYDDKDFRLENYITRSEAVSLITKAFDFDYDIKTLDNKYFVDVKTEYWAYEIILKAAY